VEELQYLRETGEIPENVMDLLSHTTGKVLKVENVLKPLPSKVPKPALEILQPPQTMVAKADNIARTHQELVANCGDELVVFGWIPHRTEAVAYNTRIQRAGRIPADRLNTFTSSPFMGGNLCIAKERQTSRSIDCIAWSAGDCIFVWDRIEGKHCIANGFGFNRATGAIGRFETTSFNLPALP
jgi:hypothetical protein